MNRRGILCFVGETILDRCRHETTPGQLHRERILHRMVAGDPGAAMDQNHGRKGSRSFRLKEIKMHLASAVTLVDDPGISNDAGRQISRETSDEWIIFDQPALGRLN